MDSPIKLSPRHSDGPAEQSVSVPNTCGQSTRSPSTCGPSTHGSNAHGPSTRGPSTHGPSAHGPSAHGPSAHGLNAHGLNAHGLNASRLPLIQRLPPQAWFGVSAVFHYLGPSCAVLLFPRVGVLGVAWLRIAAAAVVFAPMTRPWRVFAAANPAQRRLLLAFGITLAAMNCCFYLALERLPISLVAAIEFVGTLVVALLGMRTMRNVGALALALLGVALLLHLRWSSDSQGLLWAVLNGLLFVIYIVLGHRLARSGAGAGILNLGTAMLVAFVVVCPIGAAQAFAALDHPILIAAGFGVGVASSVIPYVCDQIAMSRLPRASFALLLSLLPACAAIIGAIVLRQIPSVSDALGIVLVILGVALHEPRAVES